jgi:hypothetical protein
VGAGGGLGGGVGAGGGVGVAGEGPGPGLGPLGLCPRTEVVGAWRMNGLWDWRERKKGERERERERVRRSGSEDGMRQSERERACERGQNTQSPHVYAYMRKHGAVRHSKHAGCRWVATDILNDLSLKDSWS